MKAHAREQAQLAAAISEVLAPHIQAQQLAIEDIAGQLVELRAGQAELREQVAGFCKPAPLPPDYLALKVAAWRLGVSDETLRRRCQAREVDAIFQLGRWYVRLTPSDLGIVEGTTRPETHRLRK
jgi:hypothetical protein